MIRRLYAMLHRVLSPKGERGQYSSGVWQDMVRSKALELCVGRSGSLLEIGCGEGLFLSRVKETEPGLRLYGLDNSVARIAQARARLGGAGRVIRGDARKIGFSDCSFDIVVCVNVLFNLDSADTVKKVLAEAGRVCRKGGVIIIDFRNAGNPLLGLKYALAARYDPTVKGLPLRTYTVGHMEQMLAECGLRVRARHAIGFFLPSLAPVMILEVSR